MEFSRGSCVRVTLLILLIVAIVTACFTLPIEQMLRDFLYWVDNDLGIWGPLVLAVAYIPLTILAVPASVLTMINEAQTKGGKVRSFTSYCGGLPSPIAANNPLAYKFREGLGHVV